MSNEKNNRFKGIVGTIGFHLLALLAILYFALSTPLPLPGEEGVEVNLGSSNVGMGQVQEQSPPPVQQPIPQPPPPQNDPEPEPEEDIITQDVEEAPAIEEEEIEEKEEEIKQEEEVITPEETPVEEEIIQDVEEEAEPEPEPPKVNERALYKGNTETDGDGSNQGETGQPGDQGKPDGTIDSRNYEGSGKGDQGIGYDLGGRGALSLSKPVYTSEEVGTVKIKVWVNKSGQVTKAVFEMKGSNNSSPALVDEAIKAALKSKFEADPNAPDNQIGYITYHFVRIN